MTSFHPRFPARSEALLPGEVRGPITLRLVVDACSVEAFDAGGAVAMTALAFPPPGARQVRVAAAASVAGITLRVLDGGLRSSEPSRH